MMSVSHTDLSGQPKTTRVIHANGTEERVTHQPTATGARGFQGTVTWLWM
jgi:hypothetical protein